MTEKRPDPADQNPAQNIVKGGLVLHLRLLFFIIFILLLPLQLVFAQVGSIAKVEDAIEKFHFNRAEKEISAIPSSATRHYYLIRILFLKNLLTEDPAFEEPFLSACKAGIEDISTLPATDPFKRTYLSEIYFQRGVIRYQKKNYLGLAGDLQKSCEMAEKNQSRFPVNPEQMKLAGGYRVVLSTIPQNWQWLTGLLCFRGDVQNGLENLEKSARESSLLPFESEVVLYYYEKNILSNPELAHQRMARIAQKKPGYFIYRFLEASSLSGLGRNEEALKILDEGEKFRTDAQVFYTPIWDHYRAKAHLFKLDFDPAIQFFTRFLTDFKGKTFRGDATFKLGLALELSGRREASQKVFASISGVESSGFDMDDYALAMSEKFARQPMAANEIVLFKARFLFDGGYYNESQKMLEGLLLKANPLTSDEKTELYYRLARNFGELKNIPLAEKYYAACIEQTPGEALWMKAYAAYYAGKLMESQEKYPAARGLYEFALTFEGYFYQGGLEQRCKAALQQLPKL
ncbi:MAG: hypothetical protein H6581_31290 [Bacteroidia bacterium]|nr:hypothetical protein [Bacteroidia bacterium]